LDTDYPGSAGHGYGTFGGGGAGVNLEQLFLEPSYSVSVSPRCAVGASIVAVYQIFATSGLSQFAGFDKSGTPNKLTNQGNDSSLSVAGKVGILYNLSNSLTFGAVYQSGTSGAKFSKYSDLFANNGEFDIPASTSVGLGWRMSKSSLAAFDVQYIEYGDIGSIANPFSNLLTGGQAGLFGGSNGAGFGWRSTTYYKLGFQHDLSSTWAIRGGVAYGNEPVRSSEVLCNILAPGVVEWHYTLGGTVKVARSKNISFAVMYAPDVTVSGPNPMEVPNQQLLSLSMSQIEWEASYGVRY
jgi:long-chain fatty acid transport protein